jgi:hypothetical protein
VIPWQNLWHVQCPPSLPSGYPAEEDRESRILTKVDFQSLPRYDYVSRMSLGEMTGEILIEKSLELVNKASASDR